MLKPIKTLRVISDAWYFTLHCTASDLQNDECDAVGSFAKELLTKYLCDALYSSHDVTWIKYALKKYAGMFACIFTRIHLLRHCSQCLTSQNITGNYCAPSVWLQFRSTLYSLYFSTRTVNKMMLTLREIIATSCYPMKNLPTEIVLMRS